MFIFKLSWFWGVIFPILKEPTGFVLDNRLFEIVAVQEVQKKKKKLRNKLWLCKRKHKDDIDKMHISIIQETFHLKHNGCLFVL